MTTQAVLQKYGTQLMFADHATDFAGQAPATAANSYIVGSPTSVQMNFSIIAAAAAWESAKTATLAHTGSAWPMEWVLGAVMESTATPAAGGTFDFYWNASPSATAGTGNSGEASGLDSAIAITHLLALIPIGSMTVRANVINKDSNIGTLWLPHLYGSLIMVNNTSVAMVADADADECFAVLTPIIPDVQAAA
ncbi:MAG TPA: hypothetical protein VMY37_23590 [Thermoguttaceae bacterium]|nr:hypothetical protein [Thermoguttaceae bacterium]